MHNSASTSKALLGAVVFSFVLVSSAPRAHAVSKEIVELQTQVQQLQDAVQRLQSTVDTKTGVLQHLAEQTADAANQMTATVNALQQKLSTQNDATGGKLDTISGQVQSLNDSVDELKARMTKLDKTIQDLQAQLQNLQVPPAQTQQGSAQSGAGNGAMPGAGPMQGTTPMSGTAPQMGQAGPAGPGAMGGPVVQQAPPLQETLQAGVRDYNAGKYPLAQSEFQDVVHYYPLDDLSGTAEFYLGEISYQQKDYATAIADYNQVLEGFSGNSKAAAAQLHKGYALLGEGKHEEGIHELRSLIQRHPQTPEARAARTRLAGMGVKLTTAGGH
ncbi:MAG: tetratricopeptide repeat protein [Terracidiphilus sp.]